MPNKKSQLIGTYDMADLTSGNITVPLTSDYSVVHWLMIGVTDTLAPQAMLVLENVAGTPIETAVGRIIVDSAGSSAQVVNLTVAGSSGQTASSYNFGSLYGVNVAAPTFIETCEVVSVNEPYRKVGYSNNAAGTVDGITFAAPSSGTVGGTLYVWGERAVWSLVGTLDMSSGTTVEMDTTGYTDWYLAGSWTHASSSFPYLQVSDDGGSTWHATAGDYPFNEHSNGGSADEVNETATNSDRIKLFGSAGTSQDAVCFVRRAGIAIPAQTLVGCFVGDDEIRQGMISVGTAMNRFRIVANIGAFNGGSVPVVGRET